MKDLKKQNETICSEVLKHFSHKYYLCVVMPAYNEGAAIKENLLDASHILSGFVRNYQIIAINDGSADNTAEQIIKAAKADPHIAYVSYHNNMGKGYAITKGVQHANADYIAFLDSDMELNPKMLRYFLRALQTTDADIAIGSKLHKKSKLNYPISRKVLSVGYYVLLKLLFNLKLKDTQTGIKLFKSEVIKPICSSLQTYGYAFDIEILAKASSQGCRIIELPIELNYNRAKTEKTRFSLKQIFRIFHETLKIRKAIKK
ncbi:MAG: glycosyltransferase family 2 protein [Clostridium sp.]|nr:glycosyltransferase family 2 protein [Clostridium sp.]MCM1399085.1 glycosyltransferase family 2 protein [Clostridium sp.]MCM1459477.1 glycosyltransferase family 2 protein [Bacteroides sp.]